ncbi:membrane protein [Blastomonas marina]|uniref:Membrane protein n=1 Tax=Blastomonas marina TaxID=1867408 RepID=A0ABQ1FFA3_9SPHN|nr:PH domain-containing protein [Blastomonas marina]GGA07602.1 membrane protein [Blastomonas marina]
MIDAAETPAPIAPEDHAAVTVAEGEPVRRTAPIGLLVRLVDSVRQAILPAIGIFFVAGEVREALGFLPLLGLVVMVIGFVTWLGWWKTTYRVGAEDIRVESGIVSRQARSVPYERIQDVSLEQPLVARLFGLVRVKFETGAGGGEDLNLAYVTESEAERLRETVRAQREGALDIDADDPAAEAATADGQALFAMDEKRLLRFGLFEFSLVIFAVIFGAIGQLDFLFSWDDMYDAVLGDALEGQGRKLAAMGLAAQVLSAIAAAAGVVALGLVTGVVQTFVRDHGFLLERTAKGFRRRRGLFTRTDVVMPAHRVQAMTLGTKWFRRLFGWHSLKFVSLASDAKKASHVVVPFGQMDEIVPVAEAARIALPPESIAWVRPTPKAWIDTALIVSAGILVIGAVVATTVSPWLLAAPVPLLAVVGGLSWFSWRRHRHATALEQVFVRTGILSPQLTAAPKVKLQSVEIAQGPLAQWRGYATVQFGLAGGTMEIPGVPIDEARRLRHEVIEAIAAVDFSVAQEA